MKVKQVEYRKLVTTENYSNESYGCVVELDEGESEEAARVYAEGLVDNWFLEKGIVPRLQSERHELEWKCSELHREVSRRKDRLRRLIALENKIMGSLGLEFGFMEDDIPF